MSVIVENRPYWFDFEEVFQDLWDDLAAITHSFGDTINMLQGEPGTDSELALAYAGVSAVCTYS